MDKLTLGLLIAGGVLTLASVIVRITPTHSDDNVFQKVIDFLGRFGFIRDNGDGTYSAKWPFVQSATPPEQPK